MNGILATCEHAVAQGQRRQSRPMTRNIEIKARAGHMAMWMAWLGVAPSQRVAGAYGDLLAQQGAAGNRP